MKIGNKRVMGGFLADTWQRVYSNTLSSAETSITISDLDGNTAEEYILRIKMVSGATNSGLYLRPNNDTGNNYGYQLLYGNNTSLAAERNTNQSYFWLYASSSSVGEIIFCDINLYAKSGYIRTLISNNMDKITTTTVTTIGIFGQSWNNTADNITSLVILSNIANGLGAGTIIELYAKKSKV